jgi:hypothetical protein
MLQMKPVAAKPSPGAADFSHYRQKYRSRGGYGPNTV